MAVYGLEWLIVAAIILLIFLWGPAKLPELARSIGLAKRELKKASEGEETDPVIVAAKNLGISTEGKTHEELAKQIAERTSKKYA